MERITIPSSVKSVGEGAFAACDSLSEVNLREGLHDIELDAFNNWVSLEHVNIPPVAFVIDTERSICQLMRTAMPAERGRKLVVSKWMQYRSPSQLEEAKAKVNEIMGHRRQTEEEKIQCIREWFAYYHLLDVTTMLELAIWRCNVDAANAQDANARQASRRNCGSEMNVIIPGVLQFFDGSQKV